jgi:hypothetical protein
VEKRGARPPELDEDEEDDQIRRYLEERY